tara:strand:+ start:100 stop:1578 length:1479 start_codon:yes stop_codon:yes gene_type:complete
MDETNPVYENFRNKMSTFGQPIRGTTRRISASKFLGRDLAAQVEINSRKITILKNVLQAQQIQTGVMLASLSGQTIDKNIMDIKETMSSILATLVAQEKFEMKQFLDMQRRTENLRRREREDTLETDSKGMKILKSSVNKVLNPVKGIFQRIFQFFFAILGGRLLVNLLNFFANPRNSGLVNAVAKFIEGNFGLIMGGVVAAGLGLLGLQTALIVATNALRIGQLAVGAGGPLIGGFTGFRQRGKGTGAIPTTGGGINVKNIFKGKLVSNALRFILRRRIGGIVPGSGSNDTVPAMLTPGEVVISKPAAQKFGISNLLAINAAAGAKSKPIIKNNTIYAQDGAVIPSGLPDVSNLIKLLVGTAEQLPSSPLGQSLSSPEIPNALRGVAESFAMPKSQQKNMGQNIMNIVGNRLGGKLDTSKMEGVIKEFPNLTPPNMINEIKRKGGFENLNDFIQKFNNPNLIDEKGFENDLDEISFFEPPKEKWLTYGAVV